MTYYDALTERDLLLSAWQSLRRIESALSARIEVPAPNITVEPPDLTDIVTAVQGLQGTPGPTADDIARAIADVLAPARPDDGEALRQVAEGLKMLDHRLQGFGKQAYGGGTVSLRSGQTVGLADGATVTLANVVGTLANGVETAVSTPATQVVAANPDRRKLIIQNVGANSVRIGATGVTATTGVRLAAGVVLVLDQPGVPSNAIFAIRDGALDSTVLAQEIT